MVTFENDGSLMFRVYLPHAQSVCLVADFTQWQSGALPLQPEEDAPGSEGHGWWSVRVRANDGDHAFSYLVDGQWWLPDYAAHGVKRNEHGSWTSLLFVPPPPRILKRAHRRCHIDDFLHADRPTVEVKPEAAANHARQVA